MCVGNPINFVLLIFTFTAIYISKVCTSFDDQILNLVLCNNNNNNYYYSHWNLQNWRRHYGHDWCDYHWSIQNTQSFTHSLTMTLKNLFTFERTNWIWIILRRKRRRWRDRSILTLKLNCSVNNFFFHSFRLSFTSIFRSSSTTV